MSYDWVTNELFDEKLAEVLDQAFGCPSALLTILGVYEILAEKFNNEVLDALEEEHKP